MLANDITAGQRFGILTVIKRDIRFPESMNSTQRWTCRCDCGKEVSVPARSLVEGKSRSCGEHGRISRNLCGQRFGRLVVLEKDVALVESNAKGAPPCWICRCDCGKQISVSQYALTGGKKTDCGCKRREIPGPRTIDMTGQRFGRLTVLELVMLEHSLSNGQHWSWKCQCDCGNETIVPRYRLISGQTKSCGCLASETSRKVLRERNPFGFFGNTKISAIRPERSLSRNNSSGVTGVSWDKKCQRWIAYITFQKKRIRLGRFEVFEDAVAARKEAEEKYFIPTIKKYDVAKSQM